MAEQPDFENMTPDEMMAWMETLAKRQGATEGFTTEADLDIPEVDPDTAVIDEPGYVPYSESRASTAGDDTQVRPPVQAAPPPRPATPSPAGAAPVVRPPAAQPLAASALPVRPLTRPPASIPPARPSPVAPPAPVPAPAARPPAPAWSARPPEPPAPKPAPEPQGSLAWLESLAQQNDDSLFNLDLSGLGEDSAAPQPAATDPAQWLEAMAAGSDVLRSASAEPSEDTDSLRWLESLARRQGAPADELTTSADLDVGTLKSEPEAPAYTPFSFDTAPTARTSSTRPSEDPAAFLGSLAASGGYSESGVAATRTPQPLSTPAPVADDEDIETITRALNEGRATPEQIQTFFEHQMDVAETLPPGRDELGLDEDEPAVPAELPDWLLEQVQVDEVPPPPPLPVGMPPLESLFDQLEPEIPDWLREQESDEGDDLQGIFAQSDELEAAPRISVDTNDPWVEALDLEHDEGMAPVDEPPPWYLRNVSDPARVAALDDTESLSDEALPIERDVPAGQPQPVPVWMSVEAPVPESEPVDDIPEWLHEMENVVTSSEIPAWLNEPVEFTESEGLPFELEEAPPTPEFVLDTPAQAASPPAQAADADAVLESARQRRQSGDIAGALAEYEAMIRANASLQDCVDDLVHVAKVERDNPVVFRVLGDGYMRLGKLQLALDTYREALNHL